MHWWRIFTFIARLSRSSSVLAAHSVAPALRHRHRDKQKEVSLTYQPPLCKYCITRFNRFEKSPYLLFPLSL